MRIADEEVGIDGEGRDMCAMLGLGLGVGLMRRRRGTSTISDEKGQTPKKFGFGGTLEQSRSSDHYFPHKHTFRTSDY